MKSLSLAKPHLLIMVGLPGSGKTFFADKFADTFNAPCISEEAINKYTADEASSNALFTYQLKQLLRTNQTIIIDGKSNTRAERTELHQKAKAAGYEPLLIWIQTDQQTAASRALKNNHTSETIEKMIKHFTAPSAIEKAVVVSGKHTYATQAKVVLKKLSTPRAEISTHATPPVREPGRRNITIR
jgi:predicted kinase